VPSAMAMVSAIIFFDMKITPVGPQFELVRHETRIRSQLPRSKRGGELNIGE